MSRPKALTWNATQVQIYDLLKASMTPIDVAKQLGVNKSSVTKISNAMKKGQSPATPYIPHQKKIKHHNLSLKVENNTEAEFEDTEKQLVAANKKEVAPTGDSSLLLLKPVPTTCALIPIMINARYAAITELKWPEDVTWEDFLDTYLVHLFRCWGWGLQEAYKLEGLSHYSPFLF